MKQMSHNRREVNIQSVYLRMQDSCHIFQYRGFHPQIFLTVTIRVKVGLSFQETLLPSSQSVGNMYCAQYQSCVLISVDPYSQN
jgi:hypothetical protein